MSDYFIETTTGERIPLVPGQFSVNQIDELLGRVLNEDVGGGVFWAEYGVTTAAEIITAANAGKLCVVSINDTVYVLAYISGTSYARFAQTSSYLGNSSTTTIECSGSSWRSWTVTNEMTSDKVQAISSEDATSKYPSSPAVQAYVEENASLYVYHTSGRDRLSNILAAHEAGRPCVLIDDTFPENGFYQLHSIDSQKATFVAPPTKVLNLPAGDRILSVPFYIVYENGASGSYYGAELYANKIQKITETDTIAKYPSSPAVQEYVAPVKDAALGAYVTPTASGAIASFDDGAEDIPVKSLVVDIEPVQDLNGYANPWPPGGGKNLLDPTSVQSGSVSSVTGQPYEDNRRLYTAAMEVDGRTFSVTNASGMQAIAIYYDSNNEFISVASWENCPATFNPDTNVKFVRVVFRPPTDAQITPTDLVNAQLELGSTATAYAPYANICPISGWTGVKVQRSGKNIWNEKWAVGTLVGGQVSPVDFIPAKPSTAYYLVCPTGCTMYYYNADKVELKNAWVGSGEFTTPDNCYYIKFRLPTAYGTTYNNDVAINYPSTATVYEPYQGDTYDITFPSEAGTVYGGTLDVANGVLTVDRAEVDLGTLEWIKATSANNYYATTPKYNKQGASENFICSQYKFGGFVFASPYYGGAGEFKLWGSPSDAAEIYIHDENYTDATAFKTAMSGVQLVYELATPLIYQLDAIEVNTLLGVNNIYADTGDTSVTYRTDPTLIYNKLTAAIISSDGAV